MASVGSSDNLNILVQWRKHGSNDLWRYKIDKNKASLEQQIKQNLIEIKALLLKKQESIELKNEYIDKQNKLIKNLKESK